MSEHESTPPLNYDYQNIKTPKSNLADMKMDHTKMERIRSLPTPSFSWCYVGCVNFLVCIMIFILGDAFNPFEKNISQIGSFPQVGMKQHIFITTT